MTQGYTKGVPIDTDATLGTDSDQLVPSQKAVKTYVDVTIAGNALPVTATANQVLLSQSLAAPVWSTATFPGTATNANRFIQADGTNWTESSETLILGGNFEMSGAFTFTGTVTGNTAVTYPTSGTLATLAGSETLSNKTFVAPILGTPTSGTLTNCTGLPVGGISGLGAGIATWLATPSSANLAAAVTDETGSGALVFATSPTLVTPALGTPTSGTLTNCTGLPVAGGGTGNASTTAYAVQCGGTTATGAHQAVSGVGTSGQILTSQGAGALPVWSDAAGGGNSSLDVTQASHGFAVNDIIRLSGATTYTKAQADSAANAEVVGIVTAVAGVNDFTVQQSGYVTGLSGLTANTVYFLSEGTAGLLTATEPTSVGDVSKPVLLSDSTTSGWILPYRGNINQVSSGGKVVQVVHAQDTAAATGTTTMPFDDTIPQNTEGDEYETLAITPTNSSNKLYIEFVGQFANSAINNLGVALFQDSTAGALASTFCFIPSANAIVTAVLRYEMTAGTASSTTFKIRAGGGAAGTTTFNGASGTRRYGGVFTSALTITEVEA